MENLLSQPVLSAILRLDMGTRPVIQVAHATDKGCVRANNEDNFRYLQERGDFWVVVADGCGGEAAGEVASQLAVDTFADDLARHSQEPRDLMFILRDAVAHANQMIVEASHTGDREGMGTTFSAIFLREDRAYTVHAGDSRIYRKRAGQFEQLTEDHTWVQEQVKAGRMSPQEAEHDPRGSVLMKALGASDFPTPDIDLLDVQNDDVVMLTTDGLHRVVKLDEMSEMMDGDIETAARELLSLALRRGAPDNVTLVIFRVISLNGPAA